MMSKRKIKDLVLRKNHVNRTKLLLIVTTIIGALLLLLMIICTIAFLRGKSLEDLTNIKVEKEQLGIELVNAMYTFDSPYQLDRQMAVVKELVSEPVFYDLTVDNEQRTLTTYFKFKDCSCKVNIINSTDNYVLYTLDSVAMEPEREFMLLFRVRDDGVIDWVKEIEAIEFRNTIY